MYITIGWCPHRYKVTYDAVDHTEEARAGHVPKAELPKLHIPTSVHLVIRMSNLIFQALPERVMRVSQLNWRLDPRLVWFNLNSRSRTLIFPVGAIDRSLMGTT